MSIILPPLDLILPISTTAYFPWQDMKSELFVRHTNCMIIRYGARSSTKASCTGGTTLPRMVTLCQLLGEFLLYCPSYFVPCPQQYLHFTAHFTNIRASRVTGCCKIRVLGVWTHPSDRVHICLRSYFVGHWLDCCLGASFPYWGVCGFTQPLLSLDAV
jgi:hypothetical protein